MAKLSSDGKYVTVQKGDTLSEIARDYGNGKTYKQLAAINNIKNPNLIYVGQKIYLSSDGSSSSSSSKSTNSNVAVIDHFGYQSNSNDVLFATWTWSKSNTENYETEWYYDTGDSIWFVGSKSTTEDKQSTHSIPSNAKKVRFRVKPISKKKTVNNKETSYWTASWSSYKTYNVSDTPPQTPSGSISVEIEKYKLTAKIENVNLTDLHATGIEFQVYKNDGSSAFATGKVTKLTGTNVASYSCNVDAGAEYKVRCRSYKDKTYSGWTDFTDAHASIPATPAGFTTIKAVDKTSIYLAWDAVTGAKTYEIEYTTESRYFDGSDNTTKKGDIKETYFEVTGLETGDEYFFRLRAINEDGEESGWSEVSSIAIGKKPTAPTTWSNSTKVVTGETLNLYWIHNAEDGSSETFAELELTLDGVKQEPAITIKNEETDEDLKDKTKVYSIDTSSYVEGTVIQWRVRTAGVTKEYGEWSVQRTVDIYAPPVFKELKITDVNNNVLETVTEFPIYIYALPGPETQAPISYSVSIISNETYETTDNLGNPKTVKAGDSVYTKYFDVKTALTLELSANHIDLENNIEYTVQVTVSMNSGLTAEGSKTFTVSWVEESYSPNAEISVDEDTLVAYIKPYCESGELIYYQLDSEYAKTTTTIDSVYGEIVEGQLSTTGEQVYLGTTADGDEVYYCIVEEKTLVEDISLSVYRREYDGTFTEIATGLSNVNGTYCTDPHPALDYARYRIVAISDITGAVSYYDVPGFPVGEPAVVIQWDEEWSYFEVDNEDEMQVPPWAGSMLKLPYNVDVTDKHAPDVSAVEYIGRKHPVSYYGTHLGETASWKVEIPADDKETLYGLRRLAIWMDDVYVREPSGSGYWANVIVGFSQTHCEVTIPVTLDITRVEGGV